MDALKVLKDAHRSDRTIAHYAAALKSFALWLWKDRRTREDLLADLERPTIQIRSKRIALTPDEAARLISATRRGSPAAGWPARIGPGLSPGAGYRAASR